MAAVDVMGQDSTKTTFRQKMQNAYSTVKDKTVSSYNQVKQKVNNNKKDELDSGASTYMGLSGKEWYEKKLRKKKWEREKQLEKRENSRRPTLS